MKNKPEVPKVTKSAKVVLDGGGVRMPIGEFSLEKPEPGPTQADFADAAFQSARNSLRKLMVPLYRLVVIDETGEQGFGLDRWVKLIDHTKDNVADAKGKKKVPVHRRGVAA
jgi:hypothetical protein